MKNLILPALLALFLISCKEDDPKPPGSSVNVERDMNPLLSLEYRTTFGAAGVMEAFRETMGIKFEGEVNHMTLVTDPTDPLYTGLADSLSSNFGLSIPFTFAVNADETSIVDVADELELLINLEKPFLGVTHKVSENDTSYIVDVTVKFFKDTVSDFIYIETYQLGAIDAKKYKNGTLDLRQSADGTILVNNDESTRWNRDISTSEIDTSIEAQTLFTGGSQYVHNYVVLRNFAKDNSFGTRLSEYSKFGPEFYLNDILGLKQNPIRHYFLKEAYLPKKSRKDFEYKSDFLTVVYFYNSLAQTYTIVDTYMD